MVKTIRATFEDGVFKPDEQIGLLPNTRVRLLVETLENEEETRAEKSWELMEMIWRQSTFDSQGERLSRDELHERR